MTKKFNLLQLFTIVDGRISCSMAEIYDMFKHIFGQPMMTHELSMGMEYLRENKPDWYVEVEKRLAAIKFTHKLAIEAYHGKNPALDEFNGLVVIIRGMYNDDYDIPQLSEDEQQNWPAYLESRSTGKLHEMVQLTKEAKKSFN